MSLPVYPKQINLNFKFISNPHFGHDFNMNSMIFWTQHTDHTDEIIIQMKVVAE